MKIIKPQLLLIEAPHLRVELCTLSPTYAVRAIVSESIIKLTYIRSIDQLADSFTKVYIGKE